MDTEFLNAKARLIEAILKAYNEAKQTGKEDPIPTILETMEAKKQFELFLSNIKK